MRYTQFRGLAKIKMELNLLFGCMNLKKLAIWYGGSNGEQNTAYYNFSFPVQNYNLKSGNGLKNG